MWPNRDETFPKLQTSQSRLLAAALAAAGNHKSESIGDRKPGFWFFFLAVFVPVVAIAFESQTHYCARHFFDPLPSSLHMFLVSIIPLSGFLIWLSARRNLSPFYAPITLLAGMASGVAFMYSVMFLPIMPLCITGLVVGIGLLGLSPALSMLCLWRGGGVISNLVGSFGTFFCPHQVKHLGHLVVLVTVLAVEFPSTITRIYLQMAAKPETSAQGIQFLRKFGSEEVMLRACYERSGRATDILGSLCEFHHPLKVEQARDIFYRVTGKSFNSVPIPKSARATLAHAGVAANFGTLNAGVEDEFDIDTDIAGEMVSSFARGLAAQHSQMVGTVASDAGVAELAWTFVFKNSSKYDREARAKVLLPHGAVLTGASIWLDGRERKAEIQVRQAARSAYVRAVHSRKSPLLVSMCGPDSILIQCYPVTPAQELKVKFEIAAPLSLDGNHNGVLSLPSFEERNFQIEGAHKIDLDSAKPLNAGATDLHASSPATGHYYLAGELNNAELSLPAALVHAERSKDCPGGSCPDSFSSGFTCQSKVVVQQAETPGHLVVLIDGSVSLAPFINELSKALSALPSNIPTELVFCSDELQILCPAYTSPSDPAFRQALSSLQPARCQGGQDNIAALSTVVAGVWGHKGDAVLWIHGVQPQINNTDRRLSDAWRHGGDNCPHIYDVPVTPGVNLALDGIFKSKSLSGVTRIGTLSDDLNYLFAGWSHQIQPMTLAVSRSDQAPSPAETNDSSVTAPSALAQVWAYEQVLNAVPESLQTPDEQSLQLAAAYHIVSPASSAVMLDDRVKAQRHRRIRPQNWRQKIHMPSLPQIGLQQSINKAFEATSGQLNQLAGSAPPVTNGQSAPQSARPSGGAGSSITGATSPTIGAASHYGDEGFHSQSPVAAPVPAAKGMFQSDNLLEEKQSRSMLRLGKDDSAARDRRSADEPQAAGDEESDEFAAGEAPDTSAAPEADTWLLVGAAALMLAAVALRNRLRARRV